MGGFDPDRLDGRDPQLIEALLPALERFNRHYLGLRAEGVDNVPSGPALLVANHNGGIMGPDLSCTLAVLWRHLGPRSPLFALAHDFAMRQFTPLGRVLQKLGAVRASPGNAEGALRQGGQVLVYPGGDHDAYRRSTRRDEVVLLPRTGFVRLAQAARVPIVPIVAQGAHRSAWILTEGERIARVLRLQRWARLERFPIALALPWGLSLGPWLPYLPLPFPVRLRVLPPRLVSPADDPLVIAARVQVEMQAALDDMRR